jgi:hypothetical protein
LGNVVCSQLQLTSSCQLTAFTFQTASEVDNAADTVDSAALQKNAPDVTTAPPALIVALDDLRSEFRAEIEALRQSRGEDGRSQRDFVVGLTLGAIGMCVVFILLVLLLYAPH